MSLKGSGIIGYIHVFDCNHTLDIINLPVTYRVNGMGFPEDFFLDHLFSLIQVEPDDITSVCHQGSDIPVAQVEYPFYNFLFCFFNGSLFGSFTDDGFDFIFRYIAFRRRFEWKTK